MPLPTFSTNNLQNPTPFVLRLRRTTMACSNCRKQKIKCKPRETLSVACERCAARGLECEYVSVSEQEEDYRSATSSKPRKGHREAPLPPPLPYTGPPPLNQRPRYAGLPLPELSLPSTHLANPNGSLPGFNHGPLDSGYSGSSLAGWAGPMPAPPSVNHHYPLTGHRGNLPFVSAPGINHAYNLPVHRDSFNRTRPTQPPATPQTGHHPGNYSSVQYFDPTSAPPSAWPHGPSLA
ncbi:hypothetical protein FB451DRAFT_1434926 [Mycena latifolia]|nr:hypothetical protein FB451DRAFT_1434926 [Mycena latifolia]